MAPHTSRTTWQNGWSATTWPTSAGAPYHPMTQGKIERWHQTLKNRILLETYYLPGDLEAQIEAFAAPPLPREHRQSNPGRHLLRTRPDNPAAERKDQPDHRPTPPAIATASRVTSSTKRARASLICTARCLKNSDDVKVSTVSMTVDSA